MPSIESSIVCVIALVWVWRSVVALIDAGAPAKSAWISWIDCFPGTAARFWAMRWFSAAICALALGSVADVVTAANTAHVAEQRALERRAGAADAVHRRILELRRGELLKDEIGPRRIACRRR